MPNPGTFRLDLIDEITQDATENIIKSILEELQSDKYLISLEQADQTGKLHWQGVVYYNQSYESYKKLCETYTPQWKGTRGCKGQGKRSFAKVKNEDSYTIYVSKSGNVRFRKGYSDEEIKELHEKSYTVDKKDDKKKKKPESNFESAVAYVEEEYFSSLIGRICPWDVCATLIKYYQYKVKCEPNDFQLKCMTKSIIRNYYATRKPDKFDKFCRIRAKEIIGSEFAYDL